MQILSKHDLFIFDWDHTLTTSTLILDILYIVNRLRKKHMVRKSAQQYEPKNAIKGIMIREEVNRVYAVFDDLYSVFFRPKLKKDALLVLELLRKKHKKVAIFSDSKTYRLMKETRELGVLKYVDFALSAESIGRYKPNPTGLLILMDRLKVDKKKSVYLGDMTSDILAAKFAGIDSCAISDGIDGHASLEESRPAYSFPNLSELLKALKG